MLEIKKTFVTDSKRRQVAVQIDIQTFEKMGAVIGRLCARTIY